MRADLERERREDDARRRAARRVQADLSQGPGFVASRGGDGSARFPGVLAAVDGDARALAVAGLQRAVGNARVQRLLSSGEGSEPEAPTQTRAEGAQTVRGSAMYSTGITATIRQAPGPAPAPSSASARIGAAFGDAPPGREEPHIDLDTLLAAAQPVLRPVPEPERAAATEGGAETPAVPISLPDIEAPGVNELGMTDAIAPTLAKASSVGRGGATPSGFGITYWTKVTVTGITVTPGSGKFTVAATVNNKVEWQVRGGTGPDSQKDIAGETDSDITKTNYPKVVTDLTPDASDLKGRPPRGEFWAEDLTIKHEEFHAKEMEGHSLAGTTQAQTWLGTKTASSVADVNTLLGEIPGRVLTVVYAGMPETPREERAYSDGAASYTARAQAIKKRGDEGKYT